MPYERASLTSDVHPIAEAEKPVAPDSTVVWQRFRRLFVEYESFPGISAPEPISEIVPINQIMIRATGKCGARILRHRYLSDEGTIGDFVGDPPWGEVLRLEGEVRKEHHHSSKCLIFCEDDRLAEVDDQISAEAVLLVRPGRVSIHMAPAPDTPFADWDEHASISAWWVTTDKPLFIHRLSDLTTDLVHQKRFINDVDGTQIFNGYGRFLNRERARQTGLPVPSRGLAVEPEPQVSADFPDGSTDREERDGVKYFTHTAELGVPGRYYLDLSGRWRPDVPESIIIMHFGQSNASVNDGGGVIPEGVRTPWHVVNLNDGNGARGLMGRVPKREATAFVPVEQEVSASIQSVVAVAGGVYLENRIAAGEAPVQIIVRAEAKGGQAFIGKHDDPNRPGIHKNDLGEHALCYLNLIASLRRSVLLAKRDGAPVRHIYIPFTHQEANRKDTPAEYMAQAMDLFRDVERDMADLGVPITWLLDQAGGTTAIAAGGQWTARLGLHMLADEADNIHFLQPRYPYPMFDKTHWSNEGKVIYGEFLGHAITELERGGHVAAARVTGHEVRADQIVLHFDNATPLVFDESQHPVLHSVRGFTLGKAEGVSILDASVTGDHEVTIRLSAPIPPDTGATLCYAYRQRVLDEEQIPWVVSTGALRESWSRPCRAFPGREIYRWVPAFMIPL